MPFQSDLKLLCRSKTLPRLDHHLVNLAPSLVTPRCQSVALAYLTFSHQRSYSVSLPLLGVAFVEQISPPTHPSSLAFSPAPTSSCQFCHQRSTPLSYRTMHPCPSSIQSRSVYSLAYRHQISPKSRSLCRSHVRSWAQPQPSLFLTAAPPRTVFHSFQAFS